MHQPETRLLQRDAISAVLSDALLRYPLVVLTAPMGYGKTTAARSLARVYPHRSFYFTIPSGGHNSFYLWEKACEQALAQESKLAPTFQRMGFPNDPVQIQRVVDRFKEAITGSPTLLIVDDYHFVAAPQFDAFIEALTRTGIPDLRFLMLSRTRPSLPLEELRLKGLAVHFGHELLTFSAEDAERYFALNGVADKQAANRAWCHSEGWPAALWLSLHNFLTSGTLSPTRDLEQILSGTVFSRYGLEDRKLLLQLSLFESFTPRQAASVSGDSGAPRRLRVLHDQNAFMAFDPVTDSYRMHSIFRTFLERVLTEREDEAAKAVNVPALCRKAGEWYAVQGDSLQAIRFFFKAGTDEDYLRILQVCEKPSDGLLVMFDPEGFSRMMEAISWEVIFRCPIGYLAYIYHYMSRVSREKGIALLKEAEREFARAKNISASLRRHIKGEIELIYQLVDFNDLFTMRDRHEAAHTLLGGQSAISHRQLIWTFGCPHLAFLYLRDPGTYETLVDLVNDNLFYYQEMTNGCSTGAQDLFYAELYLERGVLHKVEPFIMKAAYRASTKEQLSTLIAGHFAQARLSLALGTDEHEALDALRELRPHVERTGNPLLANSLDLSIGYIAAVKSNKGLIPAWLQSGNLSGAPNFYQGAGFVRIVHGKVLIVNKDWATLEALAQDMPEYLGMYRNLMGLIHAKIMQAIAARNLYGDAEARPHIEKALELARPDAIAMIFAEYGEHLPPLLDLVDADPEDAFIATIRKRNAVYATPVQHTAKKLAPREAAVLELAVNGKNNNEIAQTLGIKPVTVGNTLTRVYKKLGVQNRTEAAAVWRAK
ncbi:LuxR C-terminal-related transcriptional regulator [Desulfovibrio sp. OttesenSCG-928-O18]|nr:LuxR C-terminal-related transcriptional regulator [Desulfovibrio sp. OttesenSCG-928-O18]